MRAYLVAELIAGHNCWGAVLLHTSLLYYKIIHSMQFTRLNQSQVSPIDSVNWGLGFSLVQHCCRSSDQISHAS